MQTFVEGFYRRFGRQSAFQERSGGFKIQRLLELSCPSGDETHKLCAQPVAQHMPARYLRLVDQETASIKVERADRSFRRSGGRAEGLIGKTLEATHVGPDCLMA